MKIKNLIIAIMVISASIWSLRPLSCILLEDLNNGQVVFVKAMGARDELTIGWTHSVELLPWEEIFRVEHNKLIMDRTRFKTFGAGVPSVSLGKSKMEDGWVVYYDLNQVMPQLTYSISKKGRHILSYDKQIIPLYQILPDATPVSVSVQRVSRIRLLQLSFSAIAATKEQHQRL